MKKTITILLAVCLIAVLVSGCAPSSEAKQYDLDDLSAKLQNSGAFSDLLSPVDDELASTLYGFEKGDVEKCVVLCSTGATTEEIGLFKCTDENTASKVKTAAQERVKSQRLAYESYAPAEMPKLDDAIVKSDGVYVFYVVSADASKAETAMK